MIARNLKYSYLLVGLALLASCSTLKHRQKPLQKYRNVLILGNSITRHKPAPEMGWLGDWGMAASVMDSDYVHILIRKFKIAAPTANVNFKNIADYERTYLTYNLTKLDSLKQLKPELIIVRLGENVDSKTIQQNNFEKYYAGLIAYLTAGNKNARVIHGSSFWKKTTVAQVIERVAKTRGDTVVDLSVLAADPNNMALDKFKNKGVAMHPSDKGMRAIAEALWRKIDNSK